MPSLTALVTLAVGVAVAFVAGADGSIAGRFLRVMVVLALTAAAFRASRSSSLRTRGWVQVAVGLVGIVIGVGIGIPSAVDGHWSVRTGSAVVALVGGVLLLVSGSISAVRAGSGWHRIPIALGIAVLSLLTVATLGIALAATNVPPDAISGATPADHELAYRDVTFRTDDDVALSGWYVPGRNGAAVVLLHGAGSTREDTLAHAAVLAGHGYGVLLFDGRGHGRSDGRAMDFGWYGDSDIVAAVNVLAAQPEVDDRRIGAVGLSMGGEEAVGAVAAEPRLRAVVAEGVTGRTAADHAWLSDAYGLRGWLQRGIDQITYGAADLLTDAHAPIALRDAVDRADGVKVLLIAAGNVDEEQYAARDIEAAAPDRVQTWVVADAGHTGGLRAHPDEWEARVMSFLADALAAPT